jgi:5-dehydro-4-deoxyglucarate dehydratase
VYAAAYKALGTPVYSSAVFNFIPRTAMDFYHAVPPTTRDAGPPAERLLSALPDDPQSHAGLRRQHRQGGGCDRRRAGPVRPPLTDLVAEEVNELAT